MGRLDESDRAALSGSRIRTQAIWAGSDAAYSFDAAMVWYLDPAMQEALYDVRMLREFAGLDAEEDVMPDETTILKFRHLLEKHHLA